MKNEVAKVNPEEYGLQVEQAASLHTGLDQIVAERNVLANSYAEVIALEITQENIKKFKELRLKIRDNRTKGLEPWHKAQKAYFLAGGRYVDALKNLNSAENVRMEENLEENEKFFERQEAERIETLDKERRVKCLAFNEAAENIDLGNMDDDLFEALLIKYEKDFKAAQEAAKKAEEERIALEEKAKLKEERRVIITPLWNNLPEEFRTSYGDVSEKEFKAAVKKAEADKVAYELEQEKIREAKRVAEEKLKELEAAQNKLADRRAKLNPYISYILDYDAVMNMSDEDFEKELKSLFKQFTDQQVFEAKQAREQKEEEEKANKLKAKEAKLSDTQKLINWVNDLAISAPVDNAVSKEILEKFEGFKKWATTLLNNQ